MENKLSLKDETEVTSHNATKNVETSTGIVEPGEISDYPQKYNLWNKTKFIEFYPNISEEVIERVIEGFECIKEIYFLYGLRRPYTINVHKEHLTYKEREYNYKLNVATSTSILRLLDYLNKFGPLEWVTYFKYKTCAFYAYFETEQTDLVPVLVGLEKDLPNVIFGGIILQYQKILHQKNPKKFLSFILSILQAKMGMPRPGKDYVARAVKKTETHLTTKPKTEYQDIDLGIGLRGENVILNQDNFKLQLRRTVREVFETSCYTKEIHYEPFFPSTSSNYNKTIKMGGCIGELYDVIFNEVRTTEPLIQTDCIKFDLSQQVSLKYGEAGWSEQEELNHDGEVEGKGIVYDATEFRQNWTRVMDKLKPLAVNESPLVEAVGLSEALKARVISKGPPLKYTFLKPLQKFLWSTLKRNSVFQLIGQPVDQDIINNLFGQMKETEIVINGDYKASTDNLHKWVSETMADELILVLNENALTNPDAYYIDADHRDMIVDCLTRHLFEIKDFDKEGNFTTRIMNQEEGQLMGSIISFPFLCLANAAMCRWALELANRMPYRIRDKYNEGFPIAPLRVNGDDCTMKGNRNSPDIYGYGLKPLWSKITTYGGLESSIGKTLFSLPHRPVVVINSKTFDYIDNVWVERKYVPMGLLMGKPRSVVVGCQKDHKSYNELGAVHRDLIKMSPEDMVRDIHNRFLYYNANTLKEYPNIPWFMPEYIGGAGLQTFPDHQYSDLDKRCATILIMHLKGDNKKLKVQRPVLDVPWKVHNLVLERVKLMDVEKAPFKQGRIDEEIPFSPFESDFDLFDLEDNYSRFYKYLCIETLFLYELQHVFDDNPSGVTDYINRRNDYAWAHARDYADWTRPEFIDIKVRTDKELAFEKKDCFYPCVPLEDTKLVY